MNATLKLLGDRGFRALTIDLVADRATVAKTTIYRRWPQKVDLVMDAVHQHLGQLHPVETGDPLEDLRQFLDALYGQLSDTSAGRAWPLIAAELLTDADAAEIYRARIIEPRRDHALQLLRRLAEAGTIDVTADLSLIATALAAPATFHPLAFGTPAPPTTGRQLLDLLCTPRHGEPR